MNDQPKGFVPTGSAKAAYEQGRKAFADGLGIDDGVYRWARGPFLNAWWQAGWTHARYESDGK